MKTEEEIQRQNFIAQLRQMIDAMPDSNMRILNPMPNELERELRTRFESGNLHYSPQEFMEYGAMRFKINFGRFFRYTKRMKKTMTPIRLLQMNTWKNMVGNVSIWYKCYGLGNT